MFVIINPTTEKLLCPFIFPTKEIAIKYAEKTYFQGIWDIFEMSIWDIENNKMLN